MLGPPKHPKMPDDDAGGDDDDGGGDNDGGGCGGISNQDSP